MNSALFQALIGRSAQGAPGLERNTPTAPAGVTPSAPAGSSFGMHRYNPEEALDTPSVAPSGMHRYNPQEAADIAQPLPSLPNVHRYNPQEAQGMPQISPLFAALSPQNTQSSAQDAEDAMRKAFKLGPKPQPTPTQGAK